jgi:hypothetical protein
MMMTMKIDVLRGYNPQVQANWQGQGVGFPNPAPPLNMVK